MENQEVDQKIQKIIQSNDFDDLFKALSLKSESIVKAICFMLAKLAYWRELRLKRSVAPKDLTFLSRIAHFHMVNKIQIKAKPEDNKANIELIKFLSKSLKKKVRIVSGFKSKEKIVEIAE